MPGFIAVLDTDPTRFTIVGNYDFDKQIWVQICTESALRDTDQNKPKKLTPAEQKDKFKSFLLR